MKNKYVNSLFNLTQKTLLSKNKNLYDVDHLKSTFKSKINNIIAYVNPEDVNSENFIKLLALRKALQRLESINQ